MTLLRAPRAFLSEPYYESWLYLKTLWQRNFVKNKNRGDGRPHSCLALVRGGSRWTTTSAFPSLGGQFWAPFYMVPLGLQWDLAPFAPLLMHWLTHISLFLFFFFFSPLPCLTLPTSSLLNISLKTISFFFFFLSFCYFFGPLPRHMEVPRLGVESEL